MCLTKLGTSHGDIQLFNNTTHAGWLDVEIEMIGVSAPYSILRSFGLCCVLCLWCGFVMNGAVFDVPLEHIVGRDIQLKILKRYQSSLYTFDDKSDKIMEHSPDRIHRLIATILVSTSCDCIG